MRGTASISAAGIETLLSVLDANRSDHTRRCYRQKQFRHFASLTSDLSVGDADRGTSRGSSYFVHYHDPPTKCEMSSFMRSRDKLVVQKKIKK